jgi:FkbM family methyltransferase
MVERARAKARAKKVKTLPVVLRDQMGNAFELESSHEVETFTLYGGHAEPAELLLAARFVQPGDIVIDVGANVGAFTAAFAGVVAPDGAVHSFEPYAPARRQLERTIELNSLDNVTVNSFAVTNEVGHVALYDYGPGYESWSTLEPRSIDVGPQTIAAVGHTDVPSTTLDAYCEEKGIDRISLLKVDVEGAEARVLEGAEAILDRRAVDLIVIEVSDSTLAPFGERAHRVLDQLEQAGLVPHVLDGGVLRTFRVAGEYPGLANVFAVSPLARGRLLESSRSL